MKIALTYVNDPLKAFGFYTGVLGFRERLYVPEARLAIGVSAEDPDGTGLLLEPNHNPIAKTYPQAVYQAGLPVIVLATQDIQQEYRRLGELGVVFRKAPSPAQVGIEAVVEDSCGNLVQLYQFGEVG